MLVPTNCVGWSANDQVEIRATAAIRKMSNECSDLFMDVSTLPYIRELLKPG
jgi:hypothetical protein